MALADQYTLSQDANFQHRVQQALATAAIQIYGEVQTTFGHGKRGQYATLVLGNISNVLLQWCEAIATDATVASQAGSPATQANVTDAAVANALAAMWNAFAGV